MKKTKLLLALCFVSCMAHAQIIYTVGGNGTAGFSGDGGPSPSAEVHSGTLLSGMAMDASGNFYFADTQNNRVRMITPSGVISTVVGNGTAGYTGDGGQASAAELHGPTSVAFDASGNMYIADAANNAVREVNTSNVISTIAGTGVAGYSGNGGSAVSAKLNNPTGVCVDGSGNIYVADYNNNVIRVITSGTISLFAGSGASYQNNAAATSTIIQGASSVKYHNGYIYYNDLGEFVIRLVKISSGIVNSININPIYFFWDISVDNSGNVYTYGDISGTSNHVIAKIAVNLTTFNGTVTSYVGNGTAGFSGDGGAPTSAEIGSTITGLCNNSSGDLYFFDYVNARIRVVSANCPAMAGPGELNQQDDCGLWTPGVTIGTPGVSGMTYSWGPNTNLSSTTIAQPTSTYSTTLSHQSINYTVTVSGTGCTTSTSTVNVVARKNTCIGCCRMAEGIDAKNQTTTAFGVYPNPATEQVTISLYDKAEYIRITDMQSRLVFETKNIDAQDFKLDISKYNKGIYFINAKMGDKIEKQKLVVE
ncbi:MAG: T9SS type A sorting domain-containing protein [Bacteroidia bacterium]